MNPLTHIRQNVFRLSVQAFADAVGVKQPTVWRWENGGAKPKSDTLNKIRKAATGRGIQWDDRWLFEVPPSDEGEAA